MVLHSLDDPNSGEHPSQFDRTSVGRTFDLLVRRIEESFACKCIVDASPNVQDASYYGAALVPAESTKSGSQIWIRVSNFGSLATYGLELPGAFTQEEELALFAGVDRQRIDSALQETNHVAIPIDLLWTTYDGGIEWLKDDTRPYWFTRFFDYL